MFSIRECYGIESEKIIENQYLDHYTRFSEETAEIGSYKCDTELTL